MKTQKKKTKERKQKELNKMKHTTTKMPFSKM